MPAESDKIEVGKHELREIAGSAADCARRALPIFEQSLPADTRPRGAIDAAHAFAGGGQRAGALRQSAWAAYRAARQAASPAAVDAARAASHAAAAYLHPKASAHQVRHILGAAAHAARAEESGASARTISGHRGARPPARRTSRRQLRRRVHSRSRRRSPRLRMIRYQRAAEEWGDGHGRASRGAPAGRRLRRDACDPLIERASLPTTARTSASGTYIRFELEETRCFEGARDL
ncbi:MAG TPA: hypothetical protein VN748_02340 [Pseudonocardiaceae bacterium]|nr:hypothetical protein [Pseudonocardiaceae bacterium]